MNRILEKNKKGTNKILSIYWFAILILIAGGIFAMVYTFYNRPYDVRELEANVMANKIADCLSNKGYLEKEIFNGNFLLNEDNFLEKCNLNFNIEERWEEPQYYTKVSFYNLADMDTSIFDVANGNKNLISSCEIQKDKEYEKLARCVERRFYSLDEENNQYLIKILSVVRKTEKNV